MKNYSTRTSGFCPKCKQFFFFFSVFWNNVKYYLLFFVCFVLLVFIITLCFEPKSNHKKMDKGKDLCHISKWSQMSGIWLVHFPLWNINLTLHSNICTNEQTKCTVCYPTRHSQIIYATTELPALSILLTLFCHFAPSARGDLIWNYLDLMEPIWLTPIAI